MGILQGLFKAVIKNGDKVHNDKTVDIGVRKNISGVRTFLKGYEIVSK